MNIFKVLASAPREKFREDFMSALLGYLLHPNLEHGLDRLLLERLIGEVTGSDSADVIRQLNATPNEELLCALEEYVTSDGGEKSEAFVDVVCFFGDYVFAIENKIYDGSITENQLEREYFGLRQNNPGKRIIMTYLVPYISPGANAEFNNLENIVEEPHTCALITWSHTIYDIINGMLSESPTRMPSCTKYILESMCVFIKDSFSGYEFICNPSDTDYGRRCTGRAIYNILCQPGNEHWYIGKQEIKQKLRDMSISDIDNTEFRLNDKPSKKESSWITAAEYKEAYEGQERKHEHRIAKKV